MVKERLKISSPWVTYLNKLNALFGADPDIKIDFDNKDFEIKVYVNNDNKASALNYLLPYYKTFGNVELEITIIPANSFALDFEPKNDAKELFDVAFDRNPVYAYSKKIEGIFSNSITYVVFKNKVVQFFNDNLNDIHGNISTLYQDIASEVLQEKPGILYCTDIEEKVGMPLGEWP